MTVCLSFTRATNISRLSIAHGHVALIFLPAVLYRVEGHSDRDRALARVVGGPPTVVALDRGVGQTIADLRHTFRLTILGSPRP